VSNGPSGAENPGKTARADRGDADPHARRVFNVLDALVLVAAIALGLAGTRGCFQFGLNPELTRPEKGWSFRTGLGALSRGALLCQPLLVALVLAVLLLRIRRPRPQGRRLVLLPGTAVGISTVLGMAIGTLELIARSLVFWILKGENLWRWNPDIPGAPWANGPLFIWFLISQWVFSNEDRVPFALLTAWILLALSGRWRSDSSWVDRAGIILGLLWLLTGLASWYLLGSGIDLIDFSPAAPFLRNPLEE
jgi:hypothetical protein